MKGTYLKYYVMEKYKELTLKQLLLIVNENNDNLDYKSFKEKYQKHSEKELNDILNEFPNDQLFSEHVKNIKELLENKKIHISNENLLGNAIVVKKDEIDINEEEINLLDGNSVVVTEFERYDNHLFIKNYPTL